MKKIITIMLCILSLVSCTWTSWTQWSTSLWNVTNPDIVNLVNVSKWVNEFYMELLKEDSIIIDFRTTEELAITWIINWARQIDFYASDRDSQIDNLDHNKKYLIYCRTWNRSWEALKIMKEKWFTNVIDLAWWIERWILLWKDVVAY